MGVGVGVILGLGVGFGFLVGVGVGVGVGLLPGQQPFLPLQQTYPGEQQVIPEPC